MLLWWEMIAVWLNTSCCSIPMLAHVIDIAAGNLLHFSPFDSGEST